MRPVADPPSYGEEFAAVYDEWYPSADRAAATVGSLGRPPAGGRLLELGVGTGALAIPLADAGWAVAGVDDSPAMLERLAAATAHRRDGLVTAVLGDAGDHTTWPDGPFDVVLAAWNLVANLTSDGALRGLFTGAASVLRPGGVLVVESFLPAPPPRRERRVARARVAATEVRIHTDADPTTSLIEGRHIAFGSDRLTVHRWRVRWWSPEELDTVAGVAGLAPTPVGPGTGDGPDDDTGRHVAWFRTA